MSALHFAIAEDFGGEGFQLGPGVPCIIGKPGFPASLFEVLHPVPFVFKRHLRQQQTAPSCQAY